MSGFLIFILGLVIGFAIHFGYEMYQQRKAMNTYGEYEQLIEDMPQEDLDELVEVYLEASDCDTPEEKRYVPKHRG